MRCVSAVGGVLSPAVAFSFLVVAGHIGRSPKKEITNGSSPGWQLFKKSHANTHLYLSVHQVESMYIYIYIQ